MVSAQVGSFFPAPTESRILSQLQSGVVIDQIIKLWVFLSFYCLLFQFVCLSEDFVFFPRTYFPLLILGSRIISTILRKVFWIIKGETPLVCLPAKPLCALILLHALTSLFVCSSTFVLTSRKELLNLSFCKFLFLVLFQNCYYHYC